MNEIVFVDAFPEFQFGEDEDNSALMDKVFVITGFANKAQGWGFTAFDKNGYATVKYNIIELIDAIIAKGIKEEMPEFDRYKNNTEEYIRKFEAKVAEYQNDVPVEDEDEDAPDEKYKDEIYEYPEENEEPTEQDYMQDHIDDLGERLCKKNEQVEYLIKALNGFVK